MALIAVQLACGCRVSVDEGTPGDVAPICPTHGDGRVVRVTAPAPRFRGAVRGPCAVFDAAAKPARVDPKGKLLPDDVEA